MGMFLFLFCIRLAVSGQTNSELSNCFLILSDTIGIYRSLDWSNEPC